MRFLALIGVLVALVATPVAASAPVLIKRVNDDAHLLTEADITALSSKLSALEADTGAQVVVYTTPSLNGQDIESFSNAVFRATGIGQKGKDNGVLLVVAPSERKVRIEVGRRLEPVLTDAIAKLIIVNDMKPYLHKDGTDDWSTAIGNAVTSIEQYVRTDYAEQQQGKSSAPPPSSGSGAVIVIIIVVLVFGALFVGLLAASADKKRRRRDQESFDHDEVFPSHTYTPPRRYDEWPQPRPHRSSSYPSRRDSAFTTGAAVGAASSNSSRRRDDESPSRDSGWGSSRTDDDSRTSSSNNDFGGGGGDSGGGGASGDV